MLKKTLIAGLTAATLALGLGAATSPANAQVFFGFGVGGPYHHCAWGGCGYGPGWGPGWHPHHGWHNQCGWVTVRHHHHWTRVWRCRPVW